MVGKFKKSETLIHKFGCMALSRNQLMASKAAA
ncbi:hypothetical protein BKP43_42010 [Variovorax boronicumulans]|nr:hypothetical protein BKP43_42010 [Variovorax boronicumulans]